MQLRLQQMVEGLSVLAISHYALSLIAYLLNGLRSLGVALDLDLVMGILVVIAVPLVWRAIRSLKRQVIALSED